MLVVWGLICAQWATVVLASCRVERRSPQARRRRERKGTRFPYEATGPSSSFGGEENAKGRGLEATGPSSFPSPPTQTHTHLCLPTYTPTSHTPTQAPNTAAVAVVSRCVAASNSPSSELSLPSHVQQRRPQRTRHTPSSLRPAGQGKVRTQLPCPFSLLPPLEHHIPTTEQPRSFPRFLQMRHLIGKYSRVQPFSN